MYLYRTMIGVAVTAVLASSATVCCTAATFLMDRFANAPVALCSVD